MYIILYIIIIKTINANICDIYTNTTFLECSIKMKYCSVRWNTLRGCVILKNICERTPNVTCSSKLNRYGCEFHNQCSWNINTCSPKENCNECVLIKNEKMCLQPCCQWIDHTCQRSCSYSLSPTNRPSKNPINRPSKNPTNNPSKTHRPYYTRKPNRFKTPKPTTTKPTMNPTMNPSFKPTMNPTNKPTINPSNHPSKNPTKNPLSAYTVIFPEVCKNGVHACDKHELKYDQANWCPYSHFGSGEVGKY